MSDDRRDSHDASRTDPRALFRRTATRDVGQRLVESERAPAGSKAPSGGGSGRSRYLDLKARLQSQLLDEIGERGLVGAGEDAIRDAVESFVARVLEADDLPINEGERERLADELTEEATGMGPLTPLMADPAVTDILVNGPHHVFVERFGRLEETDVRFRDAEHVQRVIERIAARVGRRIDQASPMVDLRLPDGSRVNATIPPVSIDYPTLSIRRFGRRRLRRRELVERGMFSPAMETFFDAIVRARKNILVCGGTGAGKSTLLGAIAEAIPDHERILTIEDTAELILDQTHVVRLETRPPNVEQRGLITARDLVINALRMRPTRIIVGEVRGGEALDMLQAMNTGHDGGLSTIHANAPRDALTRLETMVLMAGIDLPSRAVREQIVAAIDFIIHVERGEDGVRRIECVSEITGMEDATPLTQDIFRFQRTGRETRRGGTTTLGAFVPTGIVPRVVQEMRERGVEIAADLFRPGA